MQNSFKLWRPKNLSFCISSIWIKRFELFGKFWLKNSKKDSDAYFSWALGLKKLVTCICRISKWVNVASCGSIVWEVQARTQKHNYGHSKTINRHRQKVINVMDQLLKLAAWNNIVKRWTYNRCRKLNAHGSSVQTVLQNVVKLSRKKSEEGKLSVFKHLVTWLFSVNSLQNSFQ